MSQNSEKPTTRSHDHGFTLIELSILLVMIGLIVGGVLVGRDLIKAALVKAQITQIQQYDAAAHSFEIKYSYLPGDIPDPYATKLGFAPRGSVAGQGDGNGILEGTDGTTGLTEDANATLAGETALLWMDLSKVGMIEGSFSAASATTPPNTNLIISQYMPAAKIGGGNYVYVYSGGCSYDSNGNNAQNFATNNGINYFGVSAVTGKWNNDPWLGNQTSGTGISIAMAYNIDKKIDDGLPQSGKVFAAYLDGTLGQRANLVWAGGGVSGAADNVNCPTTAATSPTSTTCYDNAHVNGAAQQYSLTQGNGQALNCALSFQF